MMLRAAVLALLVAAHVAHAQPAQVRKAFQAGVDAFRLGNYDDARAHLEKARALAPKLPGPHRFLSAVAQAQQRWDDCIASARTAMALNPRSSELADTRKVHDACRVSAGRTPYRGELGDSAAIAVVTSVTGATVRINGLTYGGTPLAPRPITAGTLDIEIDKAGWKPHKTSVDALPGIVTDVIVELEPDPTASAITPDVASATQDKPAVGLELPATTEPEARGRRAFYVLGGGAAMLAAGVVCALLSRRAADEAREIARIERSRDPSRPLAETASIAPVRTRDDLDAARDRSERWAVISNVAYGAGLVTAGIGAYLLFRGGRARSDAPPPFVIAPLRGGAVLAKELAW